MAAGRKTGGRKKGTPNVKTQEQIAEAVGSGLTPLQYMLRVMRDEEQETDKRLDAAHKAAPYVHPKLSSVDHKSSDGSMSMPTAIKLVAAKVDDDSGD